MSGSEWEWAVGDIEWTWGAVRGRRTCRAEIGDATVVVADGQDDEDSYNGRWVVECRTCGDDNMAEWRFHDIGEALRFAPLLGGAMDSLETVIQGWEVRYA